MSNTNKPSTFKSLAILVLILVLISLWRQESNLSDEVNQLQTQQEALIAKQMEFEARLHILSTEQISKLTNSAFIGNQKAMNILYLYYVSGDSKDISNRTNAFVWGSLSLMYSGDKNKQPLQELTSNFEKGMPKNQFLLAQNQIDSYKKQIDSNVACINNFTHAMVDQVKNILTFNIAKIFSSTPAPTCKFSYPVEVSNTPTAS